jgi:Protein of unknown function (DUF3180)
MRPTRWYLLLLVALVAGAVAYAVTRSSYDSLPRPGVYALFGLAVLGIAECYVAVLTRARLAGRADTRPIEPLIVARYVALAKASSLVGAVAFGGYLGFLIWVVRIGSPTANSDGRVSAVGAACALLLTAAALFLEYACRVPGPDDEARGGRGEQ